jgi:adenosine deaminase
MPFQRDNLRFPKVELHLHLDGAVRLETMIEIAKAEGVDLPAYTVPELHDALGCGSVRESLADYLRAFGYTCACMQTKANLTRIARELVEDLGRDGVDYAEIRFCPTLHIQKGLTPEAVVEAVLEGLETEASRPGPAAATEASPTGEPSRPTRAASVAATGPSGSSSRRVECNLILCDLRHLPASDSKTIIDLALAYKDKGVVAVDLAGDDLNFAALDHAPHFQRAKAGGLHVTIHAGEAGDAGRIREALDLFGAERIGHGTKLIKDPALLEEILMRKIGIEACLTSNRQTKSWEDYTTHPAREYLKRGILVSLNSDNPVLGDSSVTNEYEQAREAWEITPPEEATLAKNAVLTAFCSEETRQRLLDIK